MAKETAEEAHRRIMGSAEEPQQASAKEELYLGAAVQPQEEEEKEEEEEAEQAQEAPEEAPAPDSSLAPALAEDAKAQSLSDLRKAKDAAENRARAAEEENEAIRRQYEERLASYDLRETEDFKSSYVEPIKRNAGTVASLFKTYTGKEVTAQEGLNFLNLEYKDAQKTLKQQGVDRTDKFMELWEEAQLVQQEMRLALAEAPKSLERARLADRESSEAMKRLDAQRHQKAVAEVQSSIRTNVIGFVELADNPEYNLGVAKRLKEFEVAAKEPTSKDSSLLIAKGVVYDDLVSEIMSLRKQLESQESRTGSVEEASRISNIRPYSYAKEEKKESARQAHARIMGV